VVPPVKGFPRVRFSSAPGFCTRALAYTLDSSVRVPRRVDRDHFVGVSRIRGVIFPRRRKTESWRYVADAYPGPSGSWDGAPPRGAYPFDLGPAVRSAGGLELGATRAPSPRPFPCHRARADASRRRVHRRRGVPTRYGERTSPRKPCLPPPPVERRNDEYWSRSLPC